MWAEGVTVVTAAGNEGPRAGSVTSPGNDPLLLTVGALDEDATCERKDDAVADFSSRGSKYSVAKPDLVAPGVSLVSTAAPNSLAFVENPDSVLEDARYMRGSGTSMSAAVVTGAVAAVLGANPRLEPNGVKALLKRSTYELTDSDGAGKGALDLAEALKRAAKAPINPPQGFDLPDLGDWAPVEADAEAWKVFADAWESGVFADVREAWAQLSPQTQAWASRIFAMAVVYGSLDSADLEARGWAARGWAARGWAARGWASDKWLARGWAARGWAARGWAARGWAARGWALDDWAARGWAARGWAARGWADEDWEARGWAARGWAEFIWDARGWAARGWASDVWAARGWARTPTHAAGRDRTVLRDGAASLTRA